MAVTFDAKSGAALNINASSAVTVAHTVAADATALFVTASYWSTDSTHGQLTGITWNSVAMTKINDTGRSGGNDIVEIYFMAGPATGTHNIIASFNLGADQNHGMVAGVSFKGTPTSGGSGVVWADFTPTTAAAAANSSISVPNNTSNDALIDAIAIGAAATPTMGTQTNRTLGASGSDVNGEGEGWSYLVPAPASGSQTMNWTFASTSSAQAGVRVLGVAAGGMPPGLGPAEDMDMAMMTAVQTAMMR